MAMRVTAPHLSTTLSQPTPFSAPLIAPPSVFLVLALTCLTDAVIKPEVAQGGVHIRIGQGPGTARYQKRKSCMHQTILRTKRVFGNTSGLSHHYVWPQALTTTFHY